MRSPMRGMKHIIWYCRGVYACLSVVWFNVVSMARIREWVDHSCYRLTACEQCVSGCVRLGVKYYITPKKWGSALYPHSLEVFWTVNVTVFKFSLIMFSGWDKDLPVRRKQYAHRWCSLPVAPGCDPCWLHVSVWYNYTACALYVR